MIGHSSIISDVYELIKALQFTVELGDERLDLRIELLRSVTEPHNFRARLWRAEMCRIQSSFPRDERSGEFIHEPSDELILLDWSWILPREPREYRHFQASDPESALQWLLDNVRRYLVRATGQDA